MTFAIEFELPDVPPTQNGSRGHHYAHAAKMKNWRNAVCMIARFRRPPEPLTRAKLTVWRCTSVRTDYGNRVGAAKPIIDGLKDAGIILDDNDDVLPPELQSYLWEKTPPGKKKTRVRVEAA